MRNGISRGIAESARLSDLLDYADVEIYTPSGRVDKTVLIIKALVAQQEIEKISR